MTSEKVAKYSHPMTPNQLGEYLIKNSDHFDQTKPIIVGVTNQICLEPSGIFVENGQITIQTYEDI
jgi:hypothetical protein